MADQIFRLCYQTKSLKSYKRFMWRWDGVVSGQVFQMSRIQINEISLPYSYVTYAQGSGRVISGQPANLLVQAEADSTWCIDQMTSGNMWGWVIFELSEAVPVEKYRIKTGGDTATYPGRNPTRIRLYGTNTEATSFDDASWDLLSDLSSPTIPTTNMTWTSYFEAKKYEYSTRSLVGPNRKGLSWEYIEPPAPEFELVYLSYMTQLSGQNDVPLLNKIGSVWNFNSRRTGTSNISISGAMPNTYSGKQYATFGGNGVTGILPVTNLRKFTICGWMRSSTSGAGEFWGIRYHTAFSNVSIYLADATDLLNFNFGLNTSNYTAYEIESVGDAGGSCPTSIATKSGWAYVSLYIDRDNNRAEYWINNHHMFDISGKADLFGGAQNFDTILRFYPDRNYSGFYLCELAIWSGERKTDVPTEPLSNVYGS